MDEKLAAQLVHYQKALMAFEAAIAEDEGDVKSRNSLLLSFVFTFEMAWKALKVALLVRGLNTPDYAVAVLKAGFQAQLVDDAAAWERLKDHRNNVSHAYDEGLAIQIAAHVREHAVPLFQTLLTRLQRDD
jgi:nucleotidyltransferase substrate binding protein (TIGR01987 family)